jgi:hypothetical protein
MSEDDPDQPADSPTPAPDPWAEARIINRFRFYQTRCNICGAKRAKPSYAYFFFYKGHELQCCENCKERSSSDIVRKEYWDRIYEEPDAGKPLWRYVDLAKFLDIVLFRRLWFAQVGALEDAFEGALGTKTRQEEWRKWMYNFLLGAVKNPPSRNNKNISDEYAQQQANRLLSDTEAALSTQKNDTYVSCWHFARHESFLMWKVYARDRPDSVCIKTNLVRMRKCLDYNCRIGVVQYIDFRNKFPDVNCRFSTSAPHFCKRRKLVFLFGDPTCPGKVSTLISTPKA